MLTIRPPTKKSVVTPVLAIMFEGNIRNFRDITRSVIGMDYINIYLRTIRIERFMSVA